MAVEKSVQEKIRELQIRIKYLPKGSITRKNISGHSYPYHQWQEDGRKYSVYLREDEVGYLEDRIEERKKLQDEIRELRKPGASAPRRKRYEFTMPDKVFTGEALGAFVEKTASEYGERRDSFTELMDFLGGETPGRVLVLYGLRRTGKTVMMAQALQAMDSEELGRSAYMSLDDRDSIEKVDEILTHLWDEGTRNVFIDEVTSIEGFVNYASMFSDVYASRGMKIVLAGTDSLGFWLAAGDELFDRAYFIRTTYIPFSEWARLTGKNDMDEYIRYGGTLSPLSLYRADPKAMRTYSSLYVKNAVSLNIQNALLNRDGKTGMWGVQELYDAGELTNAVNRIVADMNHRFCVRVIKDAFVSGDLSLSAKNLARRRDPDMRTLLLRKIDSREVTDRLMLSLGILDEERQSVDVTEDTVDDIRRYLGRLDMTEESSVLIAGEKGRVEKHVIFTQPGLRWSQAEALVEVLSEDPEFMSADLAERRLVEDAVRSEVAGRMMEDIVMLEAMHTFGDGSSVFKMIFPGSGEYDMVVRNDREATCAIYEIKHTAERDPRQRRHLLDERLRAETERLNGRITESAVIYRGPDGEEDGIRYINVEGFLGMLSEKRRNESRPGTRL